MTAAAMGIMTATGGLAHTLFGNDAQFMARPPTWHPNKKHVKNTKSTTPTTSNTTLSKLTAQTVNLKQMAEWGSPAHVQWLAGTEDCRPRPYCSWRQRRRCCTCANRQAIAVITKRKNCYTLRLAQAKLQCKASHTTYPGKSSVGCTGAELDTDA